MNKKIPVVIAVSFLAFAVYFCLIVASIDSNNNKRTYVDVSQVDISVDAEIDRASNVRFLSDSAVDSADRLLRISCGVTVTASDLPMSKSALNAEFVPQEPDYVERFRNYSGDKATFVPVLMYHYFYDASKDKPTKGSNSHSIQSVEAQLQWLWENDYVTLTMDELYAWMQGEIELPARCVLLTSDDGKDDFFDILQPTLKKYGFVATSFVITSYRKNLPYKLTLSNIEMHSHTHNMHKGTVNSGGVPDNRGMIQGVSIEDGVKDMTISSQKLNNSKYMAYPYGTYGGNAQKIVKQAGFRLAFTTTPGVVTRNCNPYALPRVRVSGSATIESFKSCVRYQKMLKSIRK
ncbi:MAG: polysaccharide deacetylase family protein [Firmicutes bacterium]|nr:polysaccharide deacetylase family protein [Bacillota bacterium]